MTDQATQTGLDIRGGDRSLPAKCASESRVDMTRQMMPSDANPSGNIHGGEIVKSIDEAGGLAAMRHARRAVVTVTMDSITFLSPVHVGHVLTLHAAVNWVGKSSIEVGVRVEAENPVTGEITYTNSAYVVYVALDQQRKPAHVPPLILETDDDRRRWQEGEERQQARLARSRKKSNS